jgi:hypothetical protein
MTRAEIAAWTEEAARRVAEDKTGAPLTKKQRDRMSNLRREAANRNKSLAPSHRGWWYSNWWFGSLLGKAIGKDDDDHDQRLRA